MTSTIIRSPYPDVTIPNISLPDFVFADAAKHAAKPALIDGPSGRTITYGELVAGARGVAGGLAARGFQPGEVFAIYLPNLPEYAVAYYGVLLAGGTNTTINPLYTVEELAAQLQDADARYLLTIPPFLDKATEAAGRSGVREVFVLGEAPGATPFAALLAAGHQPPEVTIDPHRDLATLPYSSGTTGLPKGVMLSHHHLVANLCQLQPVLDAREDDVVVAVLPFFHLYGQAVLMAAALRQGATLVTMPRFDLEQFLAVLQDNRVTRRGRRPADPARAGQASAGRPVRPVGAAVHRLGRRTARRRARGGVRQAAGLCGRPGLRADRDQPGLDRPPIRGARIRHGSAGQLVPNTQAKVVDLATGEALGRDQDGELCFRGPQVMAATCNRPAETAQMLDRRRVAAHRRHRLRG